MQPTLVTARLVLRPATETDGEALWTLWTDPLVRRFLWDDRVIDRNEAMVTVTECCALAPQALGLWMLEANRNEPSPSPFPDGTVVGCAGLLPVSVAAEFEPQLAGLIEPLVALAPQYWGRGYALEALLALCKHATHGLGVQRLAGVTDIPNAASDRMLRRAGFTPLSEVQGPRYPLRTYVWSPRAEDDRVARPVVP